MDNHPKGQYAYDLCFLRKQGIAYAELTGGDNRSRVIVVPAWQGRVLTSTAAGLTGRSFGWINRKFISSRICSDQFNVYGGEERLWLGPEGGQFSFYFKSPEKQDFADWKVPSLLDTEDFPVIARTERMIAFAKTGRLVNASGADFEFRLDRKVELLPDASIRRMAGLGGNEKVQYVGYTSENGLTNTGRTAWSYESGLPSLWLLSMLNLSSRTVVFIPYKENAGPAPVLNDDYFGKPGHDRLRMENGIIYFKIDGKKRSKIGLPFERSTPWCGSYDAINGVLTILSFSLPDDPAALYVNSKWGKQTDPYHGDVLNAYNDGPLDDGSVMGPFYEIESSSPGAPLSPGEKQVHTQRIAHFEGEKQALSRITEKLFGITVERLENIFS